MKKAIVFLFILVLTAADADAQQPSYAQSVARTAMEIWKDSFLLEGDKYAKWRYDQGVILKGIEGIWYATGDPEWFRYIQKSMDFYVGNDGSIRGYRPEEYNIDHLNNGKALLTLYRVTGKEKYYKAAASLRAQLKTHPRTRAGGFWHKKIYPSQMWLDGLYMAQPFYAEYASLFGESEAFNDITRQFVLMESAARDPKTGLLYHGWDESKEQHWADKTTGRSPHVWGRALGWYGMALVDALDHFPSTHAGRDSLIAILNRFAAAVAKLQTANGLWYDIPDLVKEPRNYPEASASAMLVYTLAKGVRKGYLPSRYTTTAWKGYEGILKQFIRTDKGRTDLHGTVAVSGLGGKPYRDGSFSYYMSEPVVVNDPKGIGAFINAAVEMEMLPHLNIGKEKTVLLDRYYNNEWKKDASGREVRWHYTWEDRSNSGFSLLGALFARRGARLASLDEAPTHAALHKASVYIIVDPDTEKEAATPNTMNEKDARTIAAWVKAGGVLLVFANDRGNAELTALNRLTSLFGIRLNEDNYNLVKNDSFPQGAVDVPTGNAVFKTTRQPFIKELATLQVTAPAQQILSKEGKAIIATASYGKGSVLVIGDPWLYNEYLDGRKLPLDYDNFNAAKDLVDWALRKARTVK